MGADGLVVDGLYEEEKRRDKVGVLFLWWPMQKQPELRAPDSIRLKSDGSIETHDSVFSVVPVPQAMAYVKRLWSRLQVPKRRRNGPVEELEVNVKEKHNPKRRNNVPAAVHSNSAFLKNRRKKMT